MEQQVVMWTLSFVVTGIGGAIIKLWIAHGELRSDIAVIKNDLKWFQQSVISTSKRSARILHSPHTPELDVFLEKYEEGVPMTSREIGRMKEILHQFLGNISEDRSVKTNASLILCCIEHHPVKTI